MPIRTGLDERIDKVRTDLSEYFDEAKMAYNETIKAFTKLDAQVYKEVKQIRKHAREVNWDLTNDLLLILALNQPLMKDLRIVATYLRSVDTIERLIRHARDIARSDRSLDENAEELPEVIVNSVLKMHKHLNGLLDTMSGCLTKGEELPIENVKSTWAMVREEHGKAVEALSSLKSGTMGGKVGRLEVVNIVSRVERSAYNLVRLGGLWHHALNNENIILDD